MDEVRSVPIAGRAPPDVRRLAELAADLEGDESLSKFVGRAVERAALRSVIRHGVRGGRLEAAGADEGGDR